MTSKMYDLVGFGVVAVDDILVVDGYPEADTKQKFLATYRYGGGLTATAMVAAARLGCVCRWCGKLGDNELSSFTREIFRKESIAFADDGTTPTAEPVHSLIINNKRDGSRTILWNDDNFPAPQPTTEELHFIDSARCVFVDQFKPIQQITITQHARERGIPVVGDVEDLGNDAAMELAELTDHLIMPLAAVQARFKETSPEALVSEAFRIGKKNVVCITDGCNGSWFATVEDPKRVFHTPAFAMGHVVDTNGCGDVFHGAYTALLVKGYPTAERIRGASAAAALKTQKPGGQAGAPTLNELQDFLSAK